MSSSDQSTSDPSNQPGLSRPGDGLARALEFLKAEVAPNAAKIDQDPKEVARVLGRMGDAGLMALKRPAEFGGPALTEPEFRTFQEECARASGTFAFLQTQHQSAATMLARSDNRALAARCLPAMGNGELTAGIGFSQLRRPGPPVLQATKVDGGYVLDGSVPWATGSTIFQQILIGASLPDGQAVFGLIPFSDAEGIKVSEPMALAAMEAAMTVSIELKERFLPESEVAYIRPVGWIARSDMINIALQGHFAIGCALAGLDVLGVAAAKKQSDRAHEVHRALVAELDDCRAQIAAAQATSANGESDVTTDEKLQLRAWAVDLAYRCAQAAVIASSGVANSLAHPAQRIYREALVFSVSAQTREIMEACLNRLTRD